MADGSHCTFRFIVIAYVSFIVSASELPKDSIAYSIYRKLSFDRDKYRLYIAGNYIAAHKYFGADYRYVTEDANITDNDRVFYKQFPTTPLQDLDTELAKQCKKSLKVCIDLVYDKAKDSTTLSKFFKPKAKIEDIDKTPVFAPFKSAKDMFLFRQTVSYYLCSYAVHWKKLGKEIVHLQHTGEPGCIDHLVYVSDVPRVQREIILQNVKQPWAINDFRSRADSNSVHGGAMCAMLWFCPDPCLGRHNGGTVFRIQTYSHDPGNPCRDLGDPRCDWDWKMNNNFEDFIRNRFNVSCSCFFNYRGFRWSNEFGLCIDRNECQEKSDDCREGITGKVCVNTPGSYKCLCKRGYKDNPASRKCEVDTDIQMYELSSAPKMASFLNNFVFVTMMLVVVDL